MRQAGARESWAALEARAQGIVERSARVKRKTVKAAGPKPPPVPADLLALALSCPTLVDSTPLEWRLLAHAYGLPSSLLSRVHGLVRVVDLPGNVREQQVPAFARRPSALG